MGEVLDKNQHVQLRHPFHLPNIPVEVDVTNDILVRMFNRIKHEWEFLGNTEPYWSTITQPQYHKDQFEGNREQFYNSGKYVVDLFLASLRRNGINPEKISTLLEVGSGVGRVTQHLARNFKNIIAADISSAHLEITKSQMRDQNIENVQYLHWSDPRQVQGLKAVDAVLSVITLQHNSPPVMAWVLKNLLRALNIGGVAYIQIATYKNGYLFEAGRYLETSQPNSLEMHFLPQFEVFKIIEDSDCICLEIREDGMVGDESQMLSNTFLIQKH
jgi:SAM-dependent methyltransferase